MSKPVIIAIVLALGAGATVFVIKTNSNSDKAKEELSQKIYDQDKKMSADGSQYSKKLMEGR